MRASYIPTLFSMVIISSLVIGCKYLLQVETSSPSPRPSTPSSGTEFIHPTLSPSTAAHPSTTDNSMVLPNNSPLVPSKSPVPTSTAKPKLDNIRAFPTLEFSRLQNVLFRRDNKPKSVTLRTKADLDYFNTMYPADRAFPLPGLPEFNFNENDVILFIDQTDCESPGSLAIISIVVSADSRSATVYATRERNFNAPTHGTTCHIADIAFIKKSTREYVFEPPIDTAD